MSYVFGKQIRGRMLPVRPWVWEFAGVFVFIYFKSAYPQIWTTQVLLATSSLRQPTDVEPGMRGHERVADGGPLAFVRIGLIERARSYGAPCSLAGSPMATEDSEKG